MKKRTVCKMAVMLMAFSLCSGLFGCGAGGGQTADEIVSFYTYEYGMARRPVYSFSLRKEGENWLFSASCDVKYPESHYTSFGYFPIPAEDAEGFLEVLREEGEIKKLKRYRDWRRFLPIDDAPMGGTGMTFSDSSVIERNTWLGEKAQDALYDLANKHCAAAESVQVVSVAVCREGPAPSDCCTFALEKGEYDTSFSFCAAIGRDGEPVEITGHQFYNGGGDEIFRIVREQRLAEKARGQESAADGGSPAAPYRLTLGFADGSSITASMEGGKELFDAFYCLAEQVMKDLSPG